MCPLLPKVPYNVPSLPKVPYLAPCPFHFLAGTLIKTDRCYEPRDVQVKFKRSKLLSGIPGQPIRYLADKYDMVLLINILVVLGNTFKAHLYY